MAGEVAFADRRLGPDDGFRSDGPAHRVELPDAIDEVKVLKAHAGLKASRPFGSDKLVDARTQVLHYEVLIGRRLALVDLLGPLLERHFDPERLVDGEGDIEEVEAVDAEVVNGVARGLALLERDVARLGNDIDHGVERR